LTLPDKTDTESKHFFDDNKKSILEMANKPIALLTIAQAHGIKVDTIKVEASAFDWNLLGRIQEKDLEKREVKHIEAESVQVDE
jgi:hypothetical protein